MEIGKPVLGYVVCLAMPDGAFIGGALIVDALAMPVEFRHTEPITPSRLQRVLYGRVLDAYMHNDVVLGALLGAVEATPKLYVVGDPAYLTGGTTFGVPAVWLSEARNVPAKEIGARHDHSNEEYILHLGPGNGPIRVRMDLANMNRTAAGELREDSSRLLADASQTMELIEPLRRVEEAVRLIWDEQQLEAKPLAA